MGVGLRLKELLRDKGMSIKELSVMSNVPANTLYSITRRDSERVDPIVLRRVSKALNVSINTLTGTTSVPDRIPTGTVTVRDVKEHLGIPEETVEKIISKNSGNPEAFDDDTVVTMSSLLDSEIAEHYHRDAVKIFSLLSAQSQPGLDIPVLQQLLESSSPEWQYASLLLLHHFSALNLQGRRKALTYLRDLSELPRYQALPQPFLKEEEDNDTDESTVISIGIPKTKNNQRRSAILRDPGQDEPGKAGIDETLVSSRGVEPESN